MVSSDELESHIQALPQELQDHILDFTLAIKPKRVAIDPNYKPPWQLAVNRKTRQTVAKDYYSTSTFVVKFLKSDAKRWLQAMTQEHCAMITDIREHRRRFTNVESGGLEDKDELIENAANEALIARTKLKKLYGIKLQRTTLESPYFINTGCGCCGCQQPCWATTQGAEYDEEARTYWVTEQGNYNETGIDEADWWCARFTSSM